VCPPITVSAEGRIRRVMRNTALAWYASVVIEVVPTRSGANSTSVPRERVLGLEPQIEQAHLVLDR
jgi:hypothetical protein